MSREIIQDDMNLLLGRAQGEHFCKEGDEVATGMAGSGASMHTAGLGIQGGIQGQRATSGVIAAVKFGSSRRKGYDDIEPVHDLKRNLDNDAERYRRLG